VTKRLSSKEIDAIEASYEKLMPRADLKLRQARRVWGKRHQSTPSGKLSWEDWWERQWDDDYDDYVAQQKEKADVTGTGVAGDAEPS
jgi:hypothetical protein